MKPIPYSSLIDGFWGIYLNKKCWEYAWEDIEFKNIFLLYEYRISDILNVIDDKNVCKILKRTVLKCERTYR